MQIDDFLRRSPTDKRSALIILDLDNFKQVNDRYGHMFGDTVLSKSANLFRTLFRDQDIIGRFGGDEFVIFLKQIPTLNLIHQRCKRLLETFNKQIAQELSDCQLSCSIGVSSPLTMAQLSKICFYVLTGLCIRRKTEARIVMYFMILSTACLWDLCPSPLV